MKRDISELERILHCSPHLEGNEPRRYRELQGYFADEDQRLRDLKRSTLKAQRERMRRAKAC